MAYEIEGKIQDGEGGVVGSDRLAELLVDMTEEALKCRRLEVESAAKHYEDIASIIHECRRWRLVDAGVLDRGVMR